MGITFPYKKKEKSIVIKDILIAINEDGILKYTAIFGQIIALKKIANK